MRCVRFHKHDAILKTCEKYFCCTKKTFFQDALALVRLDDLYLESFDITDGKYYFTEHHSDNQLLAKTC